MEIIKTRIDGLVCLKPKVHVDNRGYFFESYTSSFFEKEFVNTRFVQENESKSNFGVFRGLHFQMPPFAQAKLVRVISGKVLDIAVDLRKKSKTFGQYESIILSGKNKKQFFIPRGFAHGFLVLSKTAIFSYKVDNFYSQPHENGINYLDDDLSIKWPIKECDLKLSEKDLKLNFLKYFKSPF